MRLLILSIIISASYLFSIEINTLFTNPKCAQYTKSLIGNRSKFPKNIFCSYEDDAYNSKNSKIKNKIIELIKDLKTEEIWIATFDLSDEDILNHLCQRLKRKNFNLSLVVNSNTNLLRLAELSKCTKKIQNSQLTFRPISNRDKSIGLFHSKYLIINPNKKKPVLIFSSGNLSSGMYKKHENWNFLKLDNNDYLLSKHHCHFKSLLQKGNKRKEFINVFQNCIKNISSAQKNDTDISSFFIPSDGKKYMKEINNAIINSHEITLVSHRLTIQFIIKSLIRHLKKGRVLNIYADSGYLERVFGQFAYQTEQEFFNLLKLQSFGAKIIPVYTNQSHSSYFHHKFIIMDRKYTNEGHLIFTGSGNYTSSAIQDFIWRDFPSFHTLSFYKKENKIVNYENFYVIKKKKTIKQYQKYLEGLQEISLTSLLSSPFHLKQL